MGLAGKIDGVEISPEMRNVLPDALGSKRKMEPGGGARHAHRLDTIPEHGGEGCLELAHLGPRRQPPGSDGIRDG